MGISKQWVSGTKMEVNGNLKNILRRESWKKRKYVGFAGKHTQSIPAIPTLLKFHLQKKENQSKDAAVIATRRT